MKQFSILFLILISFYVDAQVSQEEFNQLKSLVLNLQQEKDSINGQLYQVKKKEFFDMKYQIENAYDKTDVIEQAGIYQSPFQV